MQQHVYCLGYVSFVLVMYSLPEPDLTYTIHMLLHNYVQHEKCLPSVTKNYELYYSLKMVN